MRRISGRADGKNYYNWNKKSEVEGFGAFPEFNYYFHRHHLLEVFSSLPERELLLLTNRINCISVRAPLEAAMSIQRLVVVG